MAFFKPRYSCIARAAATAWLAGVVAPASAATVSATSALKPPTAAQISGVAAVERQRGAAVFDDKGNSVGSIDVSDNTFVTVITPHNRVQIPANAFHKTAKGLTISIGADELDTIMAASAALQKKEMAMATLKAPPTPPMPPAFSFVPKGVDPNAIHQSTTPPIMLGPTVKKSQ